MANYLKNTRYVAGWDSEIQEPTRRMMLDVPILLFRDSRGEIHAMKDACSHRFAPLSRGKVCGEEIQCPYHGLRFDTAGQCTHNPHCDGTIPPNSSIQTYPVELRHGAVWVWMGDADKCDPSLIPDYPAGDLSKFKAVIGHMTVKANYQQIFDNLLDLSHVNYLHPALRAPNDDVQMRQKTRQTENSVSAYLWRDNALPNGLQNNFWPADKIGDARGHMHWFAPPLFPIAGKALGKPSSGWLRNRSSTGCGAAQMLNCRLPAGARSAIFLTWGKHQTFLFFFASHCWRLASARRARHRCFRWTNRWWADEPPGRSNPPNIIWPASQPWWPGKSMVLACLTGNAM